MSKSLFKYVYIPYSEGIKEYTFYNFKLPNKIEFPFHYSHELCHILQFKRNEQARWNKGYLIFNHSKGGTLVTSSEILPTEPSKTLKPFNKIEKKMNYFMIIKIYHKIIQNFEKK